MSAETACRICHASALSSILDLGATPLANRLLPASALDEPEPRFPLKLVFCERCTLLQITETVPPEELFRDYVYFSSFSDTVLRNAEENARRMLAWKRLGADDLVVELASNDGYLLQFYLDAGVPVLGIEPALNIATEARARGIDTIPEFFGPALASQLVARGVSASVIHAHNVLAHVPDLGGFVRAMRQILRPDGIIVVEVPYAIDMIDRCEFDTIYHEHLCYFSATALAHLFGEQELEIIELQRVPIHGGSLRISATHRGKTTPSANVEALLDEERAWGVAEPATYADFRDRVARLRHDLRALLHRLHSDGARLAAYGASAKGSTLLNYFQIGLELLEYVVDRSTVKQGRFTPGSRLPIRDPRVLLDDAPDYLLLLTWNHAEEILHQQRAFRERGGKFIVPVPSVEIV
jgi:SAM-dependent methyltransferase